MTAVDSKRSPRFSLIDLRAGERGPLLIAASTLFGLVAAHSLLETARDALFLGQLAPTRLPIVYLLVAALGLGLTDLNARFIRRFGRRNALVVTLALFALGTTWFNFRPVTAGLAIGLYVWSALAGSLSVVQFWLFAGEAFTSAQSKRFFPAISAGGVLGAVVGSAMAVGLLALLPVGSLLLAACVLALGTAAVVAQTPEPEPTAPRDLSPAPALGGSARLLAEHGYVRRVAILVVSSTLAVLLLDYLFKSQAAARLPKEELGPFFARYYGALNTAALAVQLLLAGRILRRFGVATALAVLPLSLALGSAGVLLLGGSFLALLFTRGADGALRHSLHRVSAELLYLPLDPALRDRAKPLIDSVLGRSSQALGAAALLALASFDLATPRVLSASVIALSLTWVVTALMLRRPYLDLFRQSLGRGVDAAELNLDDLDLGAAETVIEALSSPDPARALAAMNLLADAKRSRLIPALILYHDREEVLLRALEVVPEARREDWVPLAQKLLDHPSERVVTAAVRALGRFGKLPQMARATGALRAFLAVERLSRAGDEHPEEDPEICRMLAGDTPDCQHARAALAGAIADRKDVAFSRLAQRLARFEEVEVADVAIAALGAMGSTADLPFLIRCLDVPRHRARVVQTLAGFGDRALDALEAALTDAALSPRIRRELPRAIGEVGGERAAKLLFDALAADLPGLVRFRALRALGRLVRNEGVKVDRPRLEAELIRNLLEALRFTALEAAFDPDAVVPDAARASQRLLAGLIADKQRQARERAFRVLQMLHKNEDLRSVYFLLQSDDKRMRANALEFIDALMLSAKDEPRALLRLVVDDLSPSERVERAEAYLQGRPRTRHAALAAMLGDLDDALATLAAYHVRAQSVAELEEEAGAVFSQRRWVPLETVPPPLVHDGGGGG
ncbi:MAG: HEAT repeat domain-containing protein [Myxococcales bacterium]|nr:HEAT repeat domain-containing protein [Myxococcales bacterium]